MPETPARRYVRRVAKGLWWLATPWRMPERMQILRARATAEARAADVSEMTAREHARRALRSAGGIVSAAKSLDLFDNAAAAEAAGLSWDDIYWGSVTAPGDVDDRWSAVRFLIEFWRSGPDVSARLAQNGSREAMTRWILESGQSELGLSPKAVRLVLEVLDADVAGRARQAFLTNQTAQELFPHGLTPAGTRELFGWFMRVGMIDTDLRLEEVWWLFLEAERDPARELRLAYCFAPAWQERHPDGLTVFGRDAFARWFVDEYGASGAWVDATKWPLHSDPASDIRISYHARRQWQAVHPRALDDPQRARGLIEWLATPASGLSPSQRDWCRALDVQAMAVELAMPGVNVIGHFCYPSGLRVSAESIVHAMQTVGRTTSLRDVHTDVRDDPCHAYFRGMECHDVTIIHTQPEPFFDAAYARAHLYERSPRTYRVAYWYWEFDSIPDSWLDKQQSIDEVWTATEFVASGLRERLSVPVRTLFPGVKLAPFERRSKSYFGLNDTPFTFLFTFHMMSVMERKNPLGLIRAFKTAFGDDRRVQLVLKTSFGDRHPVPAQELRNAAAGTNVVVIDQIYSPDEVLSLMNACDAYVSLHRSEGLGLTMAEAMLMGKPVIATNFSGNIDFMDDTNSLLVPYELVKLENPIPPYDAGLKWAEPSVEAAASLMRRVFENQAWARQVGARGKTSAEANLSLETAGRRISARLDEIRRARGGAAR
ncbi:MAG: glycosyltransferase [Comamonadaceae bacterium]|nr:MAG: glycosyltransferase [Comamonadaceae bacterium]